MRAVSKDEFLAWCEGVGVGLAPEQGYYEPRILGLRGDDRYSCTCLYEPGDLLWAEQAIREIFTNFAPNAPWFVWPITSEFEQAMLEEESSLLRHTVQSLRPAVSGAGAIEFVQEDADAVRALLACMIFYAWSSDMDVFLVPNDGSFVLRFHHHQLFEGSFRSQAAADAFAATMKRIT